MGEGEGCLGRRLWTEDLSDAGSMASENIGNLVVNRIGVSRTLSMSRFSVESFTPLPRWKPVLSRSSKRIAHPEHIEEARISRCCIQVQRKSNVIVPDVNNIRASSSQGTK